MNKKGSNPQPPENMLRPPPPPAPPEKPELRELREGSEAPVKPTRPKIKVIWEGSTVPVRPTPEPSNGMTAKEMTEGYSDYMEPVVLHCKGTSKYHDTPLSTFVSLCIALVLGAFFGAVYTFMYFVDKIN